MGKIIKGGFVIVLILALLAAAGVGIYVLATRYTGVVVAAVNLSPGMRLRDNLIAFTTWSVDAVPRGAIKSLENYRGMYVRENIAKGEVIFPSSLTAVTPAPVRTQPKPNHYFLPLTTTPEDAAELFVGDRVDVTVTPVIDAPNGGIRALDPVTIRKGWRVHHIDYEDRDAKEAFTVRVVVEAKAPSGLTSPIRLPVRMVKSVPRSD
ncbi:MAG: hypothetical protein DDT20_01669 [Firmicutes bacterium]|nr:hypothetical protein [Bacillota bacterium]